MISPPWHSSFLYGHGLWSTHKEIRLWKTDGTVLEPALVSTRNFRLLEVDRAALFERGISAIFTAVLDIFTARTKSRNKETRSLYMKLGNTRRLQASRSFEHHAVTAGANSDRFTFHTHFNLATSQEVRYPMQLRKRVPRFPILMNSVVNNVCRLNALRIRPKLSQLC